MTPVSSASPRWRAAAILLLCGLLAYAPSFTKAFVLDDDGWIARNSKLKNDPVGYLKEFKGRWLVGATVVANYKLGGLSVVGYHAFNTAVHLAAGLLLWALIRRVLELPRFGGQFENTSNGLALAAALIWLVHPLQTQSVTYIIQRCESMMGMLYILALYAFLRGATAERGRWWWYCLCWLAVLLGGGCKEITITLPVIAVCFDWVFLKATLGQMVRRRGLVYLGMTVALVGLYPAISAAFFNPERGKSAGFGIAITPWQYLMTQPQVILYYLRLTVFPIGQCLDYSDWPLTTHWRDAAVPGGILAVVLLASLWGTVRRHPMGFVGLWFFACLSVSSSIIPIIDLAFEHRMYLSLASFAIGFVVIGNRAAVRVFGPAGGRLVGAAAAFSLTFMLIGLTINRNQVYQTRISVWDDVVSKRPGNKRGWTNRGAILVAQGKFDESEEASLEALNIRPDDGIAMFNLASVRVTQRRYAEALDLLNKAQSVTIHLKHGMIGMIYLQQGKTAEAVAHLSHARNLEPTSAQYRFLLGSGLIKLGRTSEAEIEIEKGFGIEPDWPMTAARSARATLLRKDRRDGEVDDALVISQVACVATRYRDPGCLESLALALAEKGKTEEATRYLASAIELAKDDTETAAYLERKLTRLKSSRP
jgi:tetratricopeptide (TPR) repeat protein